MAVFMGCSMEEVFAAMSPADRKVMGEGTPAEAAKLLRARDEETNRASDLASYKRAQAAEALRLAQPHKVRAELGQDGVVRLFCDRCCSGHYASPSCPAAKEWFAKLSTNVGG